MQVDKKVEFEGGITPTQVEILNCLNNYMTVTQIAHYRKVSRASIYNIMSRLKKKGFINQQGGVTLLGIRGLHFVMGFRNKKRFHNIAFKIKVLENPRNWQKKRSKIVALPAWNKRVDLRNNSYDLFNIGNVRIKTTTQSVIVQLPAICADTVDQAVLNAMDMLFSKLPVIENMFKIKLTKDKKANITLISQEFARIQDAFARIYHSEGNKLHLYDKQGELWLIIDISYSTELEAVNPKTADEDMNIVDKFYNDLRSNPTTFSEVLNVVNEQNKGFREIAKNQLVFDANMASHIKAVQSLAQGIKIYNQQINKLTNILRKVSMGKKIT